MGAARGNDISGEKDQTLNQLLVELDGFGGSNEVVVIGASNLLEKLDTALLRPGRFDRQVFVTPPDLKGRKEILDVHTRNKPVRDVDMDVIARQTSGLTGADLANICNEAAIFAGRERRDHIQTKDFQGALERVIAGMQSRRVITEHEKKVVAYHEAGHALCSELLPSVEKVHRISIVPRGKALGYTLNLPEEDRYLKTKDELLDYLVVLLGGRVTEHIVFGEVTTGRRRRPPPRPRDQPRDGDRVRHGHRADVQADPHRRLLDVGLHPAHGRRGAAVHHRLGPPPGAGSGVREQDPAGGLRLHPAPERGAGARGHRAHRGLLQGRERLRARIP